MAGGTSRKLTRGFKTEVAMKRILKKVGLVLVVVLSVVLLAVVFVGGSLIKNGVNTFGPTALGVPVTLQSAKFMPLRGKIQLTKLHVGNPEGFKTPGLFDLGDVDIELDAGSLFSDTIVIHKIYVNAPEITYERGLLGSNFSKLSDQLAGDKKPAEEKKPEPAPAKKGAAKKVIIEQMIVRDPKLNFAMTASFGHYVPIALGQVELKDIGKEKGGVTMVDAIKIIFSVITSNIENAVLGAGDLIGSGVKAVGKGAAAVGGAAVDGASAAGGAVVDGASSAVKGIGHLIGIGGKKSETNEPPKEEPKK